jgi:hypothetical protein
MRKLLATLVVAALGTVAGVLPATAANNQAGDSLVNVQVGDVTVLVPISVAANLCDVSVNVLAQQADAPATCTATADSVATPGNGSAGGGGGNQAGDSLVNVQIGDITALIPIAVAANICDVAVNVLADQLELPGGATCTATGTSTTP